MLKVAEGGFDTASNDTAPMALVTCSAVGDSEGLSVNTPKSSSAVALSTGLGAGEDAWASTNGEGLELELDDMA
jgi:hypothetical protein